MESRAPIVRFGLFEFDQRSGELRKNGAKVKLEGQPIRLLELLLERTQEVVTQEEIRAKLWPDGTVVEFEHSIKSAVKRLRQALDDDAEAPRYVQTLPRRGYRFIAPVNVEAGFGARNGDSDVAPREARPTPKSHWHLRAALVGAGTVLAAALGYRFRPLLPPPRVLNITQITRDGRPKDGPVLTDGARVFYHDSWSVTLHALQVPAAGGDVSRLNVALNDATAGLYGYLFSDISADRSEFLVVGIASGRLRKGPLWILPAVGGGAARVGDVLAYDAAWAPNGTEIAYSTEDGIYISNRDGSSSRKVAAVRGLPTSIRWSPDGAALRFTLWDRSTWPWSLWEVGRDGNHLYRLLPGWNKPERQCCGEWTPDGKYFLFLSGTDTGGGYSAGAGLWARCEQATLFGRCSPEPVQLTAGPLRFRGLVPSRDGKKLFVLGSQPRVELVRYDVRSRRFEPFLSGISAEGVSFSRDGQWVAYVNFPEGTLWRSKLNGSERLQLSFPGLSANNPRWSPDAKKLAFQAVPASKRSYIYVVPAEGGQPHQVSDEQGSDADATWSADGESLVFSRYDVGILRLDLTTHHTTLIPGSEQLLSPSLSPSGRYLAAVTPDRQKLMLFDFTTGKWSELASSAADWLTWSRDEKYLYFDNAWLSRPGSIQRVHISDRKVESIVDLGEVGRLGSGTWGPWTGLTPDDSPLTLRDAGIDEIYALDWQEP